jgi:regulator of protease activity HflC (stomatin/prohibitin superfamily)
MGRDAFWVDSESEGTTTRLLRWHFAAAGANAHGHFRTHDQFAAPDRRSECATMFMDMSYYIITPVILLVLILLFASVRILRQYERAVVFTLGKFEGIKGPGLVLLFPFIQEMVRVDLRVQVIEIPSQDVISHDNVSMKVDAVLYFNVVDPERAIVAVQQYQAATNMLAQTTLRAVLGQHDLDEMLSDRKKLSNDLQAIIDTQTEGWGIKVSNVEIRTVELGENMVRAIAKQAEAERDRRAKVIHAEAEFQASQTLVNAAKILASVPAAMQLRYLQTLSEIGAEQNSTIVFPMPIDIIKPFLDLMQSQDALANRKGNGAASLHADMTPPTL